MLRNDIIIKELTKITCHLRILYGSHEISFIIFADQCFAEISHIYDKRSCIKSLFSSISIFLILENKFVILNHHFQKSMVHSNTFKDHRMIVIDIS